MARHPKEPRYYQSRRAYFVQIGGRQILLAKGDRDDPEVLRRAWERFREVVPIRPSKVIAITDEDASKLLDESNRVSEVFYLMYQTGCRPAEACGLSANSLDAHTQAIRIQERLVSCDEILFISLARKAKKNLTGPLLRNSRGQPWSVDSLHGAFVRLRDRLGLRPELTPFSWWHAFAVRFLGNGGSITDLAVVLGIGEKQVRKLYGG